MISYDNAESFEAKGKYIKSEGLRGFAMSGMVQSTIALNKKSGVTSLSRVPVYPTLMVFFWDIFPDF